MPPRPWEQAGNLRVHHRRLAGALTPAGGSEALFWGLFGGGGGGGGGGEGEGPPDTWWLDSATAPDRGRFSFMGGRGGSLWRRVEFRLPPPAAGSAAAQQQQQQQQQAGTLTLTAADGSREQLRTPFFAWLERLLGSQRCRVR